MIIGFKQPESSAVFRDLGSKIADRLSVKDYGVVGGLPDETAAMQKAIDAAIARSPSILDFAGLDIRSGRTDFSGSDDVVYDGNGATLRPLEGRKIGFIFVGIGFSRVVFKNFTFRQIAGFHYEATLFAQLGESFGHFNNFYIGCGFGARVQQVKQVHSENNSYRQIGVYPRPAPLDPSSNYSAFNAHYEQYAGGFRAILCDSVRVDNDFENDKPAGGHVTDTSGGPGAFSAHECNDVVFRGRAINAPGQGFVATGGWQGQDVVGQLLAGTFNPLLRGQRIVFDRTYTRGCNQEGSTVFGCRDVTFIAPKGQACRLASLEMWQCVDVEVIGGISEEPPPNSHPIQQSGAGAVGGDGVVHIVGCWNVDVSSHRIRASRANGYRVDGSYHVRINGGRVDSFGSANYADYRANGVACGLFEVGNRNSNFVAINGVDFEPASSNTVGRELFAQDNAQEIMLNGNTRALGPVRYGGAVAAFRGAPVPFVGMSVGLTHGGTVDLPNVREGNKRSIGIGTSATLIYNLPRLSTALGSDAALLIVNGNDDFDGNRNFADLVMVLGNTAPDVVRRKDTGGASLRTYTISNGALKLAMASGQYSVCVGGTQVRNGNRYG